MKKCNWNSNKASKLCGKIIKYRSETGNETISTKFHETLCEKRSDVVPRVGGSRDTLGKPKNKTKLGNILNFTQGSFSTLLRHRILNYLSKILRLQLCGFAFLRFFRSRHKQRSGFDTFKSWAREFQTNDETSSVLEVFRRICGKLLKNRDLSWNFDKQSERVKIMKKIGNVNFGEIDSRANRKQSPRWLH